MKNNNSTFHAKYLNSIKTSFTAIAKKKLTSKERESLLLLSTNNCKNLTQAANFLSQKLSCGLSTSWLVIRSLLSLNLIEEKEKGIVLSESAKFLVENKIC